jgi:hypothetical protein
MSNVNQPRRPNRQPARTLAKKALSEADTALSVARTFGKTDTRRDAKKRPVSISIVDKNTPAGQAAATNAKIMQAMRINSLEAIAGSIALPVSFPAIRWSSEFSQKRSATASPFAVTSANFGSAGTTYPQLAPLETAAFLFRQPERNAILYQQNVAGALKGYTATMSDPQGGAPNNVIVLDGIPGELYPIIPTQFNSAQPYSPHGPILFPGSCKRSLGRFIWCDTCDELQVTVVSILSAGTVTPTMDYFGPDGLVIGFSSLFATTLVVGTPEILTLKAAGSPAGYYALHLSGTSATSGFSWQVYNYNLGGIGSCFAHLALPGLSSNYQAVAGCRILGTSLMYTNTAAAIQLGGTVAMTQTNADDSWLSYVNTTSVLSLISKETDSKTLNTTNGMYGFLKPTDPTDFDYKTHTKLGPTGSIIDSYYPIDEQGSFIAQAVLVPAVAGAAGYYTVNNNVEYLTEDVWRATSPALASVRDFSVALDRIKNIDPFHENPLHLSEIWNGLKNAVSGVSQAVMKYGPNAMKIASLLL